MDEVIKGSRLAREENKKQEHRIGGALVAS